jgi:hypothetical protein
VGLLDCVSLPVLDMLIAVGGNGNAQYGIQAQYLIDRCEGIELLACVARLNDVGFIERRGITDGADEDAARGFHDHVSDVMSNAVELLVAWSIMRRPAPGQHQW